MGETSPRDFDVLKKQPLENTVSAKRQTLQDLKSLLEDRGGHKDDINSNKEFNVFKRKVFDKDKPEDRLNGDGETSNLRLNCVDNKNYFTRSVVSDVKCNNFVKMCPELRFRKGRWCFNRFKTILFVLLFMGAFMDLTTSPAEARSSEPRYETAYACEGKTLKIGCGEGSVIHLIRANYGRFSITICNDHGNTDWSVNCMSTKSLRVLHSRCSMHQNCSILASTNMFGDPCPNTLKYLEAHYQCVPASTTSTTSRPMPPWLITSQPTVLRSTVPPAKNAPQPPPTERKKPTVITPPTFRPHITLPPEVKLGDVGTKKTTTRIPDASTSEKEPPEVKDSAPETKVVPSTSKEQDSRPRNDKPSRDKDDEVVTEETPSWPVRDENFDSTVPANVPAKEHPVIDNVGQNDFDYSTSSTPHLGRAYCPPVYARGLNWNWTLAGSYAVQPCPGGATGLAKWKCNIISNQHHIDEEKIRRRSGLPPAENYHDLGFDQVDNKHAQLMRRLGSEGLLKGRDGESPEHIDYRSNTAVLPDAQASSVNTNYINDYAYGDGSAYWHGSTPDLSECRSVWLNSLEARVREGESLLSISNDLAQVTSSKTLYGGDMMTTGAIMEKLAERMSQNVQTFSDPRQREALVTDMLLGVIKTGSNLLEESQRASWADLSPYTQTRIASVLLTQLEKNAFLLADAVTKEKTILQIVKNICLSVRVLDVKSVEDETFPSMIAQEQWKGSEDTITIPKAALLDNREKDLVRIVFFAFDRLEEILPPVFGRTPQYAAFTDDGADNDQGSTFNKNITRVLNSKVISASLGNGRHIQLSQAVKLTMKHLRTVNVTNPICVFWDYTLHGWSPQGCHVVASNLTHTECSCSHLTNFAILMDVHGASLETGMALRLVTVIGCTISSIALLAALIVFQCFRNMKSDRVLIHKNLCACLLIAEVVFICGIDQTQNHVLCGVIAGILHYFFLAAFAWMFLEGFHLYAMLVEVFEPARARARWYCCAAYLAPAIVVLVSASVYPQGYGTSRHCWLTTDHLFVMSFVGPVALVLAANWLCLGMVIYMMCTHSTVSIKSKENSKLYKIRVWLNSSLVLAFLLGLTWTFGLLYLLDQSTFLAYAFTAFNSLQGLFIFIFHCLMNETFQKEMARICRRHPWLSCCLHFTGPHSSPQPLPHSQHNNANATASSSNHVDARQGSMKSRRYHQSTAPESEDIADPRDGVTSYNIQPELGRWTKPTAPIYVPSDELRVPHNIGGQSGHRSPTPQPLPHSASHSQSIASMHSQFSYRHNLDPEDYQNVARSRSPSCFSNKMAASGNANDWGLMANPIGGGNSWKSTSSKQHGGAATLPHHDMLARQLAAQSHAAHSLSYDCGEPHEDDLHIPPGYHTTRGYGHGDFRAPHVYMSQHAPGAQEMVFRKHYKDDRRRHHHGSQNLAHAYSELAGQGRMHRRGSENEFHAPQEDPVYEEIERGEMASDASDDGCGRRAAMRERAKFHGDHRPLIAGSPAERRDGHYGRYARWDGQHPPHENNVRALAAVLNGENHVVCHLEPHATYDAYPSPSPRALTQPSF